MEYRRRKADSRKISNAGAREIENGVRLSLSRSAGIENIRSRDPVYHISESFSRVYDMNLTRMGSALAPERINGEDNIKTQGGLFEKEAEYLHQKSDMNRVIEPEQNGEDDKYRRFSELSLNRGALTGATMRGGGQMMLFSCLKRALGQSEPKNDRQRKLFCGASVEKNTAGQPMKTYFNRGTVNSAVGIAVDILRDARRTVDGMTELASGKNVLSNGSGAETLRRVYPFLDDKSEKALLEQYKSERKDAENQKDDARIAILDRAVKKTDALIERKSFMKLGFINELRYMSAQAEGAAALFSSDEFRDALTQALGKSSKSADEDSGAEIKPDTAALADATLPPSGDGTSPDDGITGNSGGLDNTGGSESGESNA